MLANELRICFRRLILALLIWGAAGSLRGEMLTGTLDLLEPGTNVNLTTDGPMDWIHLGLLTEQTVNRKYGVVPQLTNSVMVNVFFNGPFWLANSGTRFSWSDGTPTSTVTNTETAIFVTGTGNGFRIQCPADTTVKTLKIYAGAYAACLQLSAVMTGSAVTGYTNSDYCNAAGGSNAVYTIQFQAATNGETLTVTLILAQTLGSEPTANLLAATLAGDNQPPATQITDPPNGAIYIAPASFSITAAASDSDGSITNLQIFSNGVSLGETNVSPFTIGMTNSATNTYVLTSRAIDDRGFSVTSQPVTVYVTTGGGILFGHSARPQANVNLTADGKLDWAHWGLASQTDFVHKAGIVQQISDITVVNGNPNQATQYADNFTHFSWTNGTPTATAVDTPTGLFIYNLGKGFQITAPASPIPRRLRVYIGLYGARGKLDASLSDWSAPPIADTSLVSAFNNLYAVYTFTYASRVESATLTVRWVSVDLLDPTFGNVTWQAATLASPPPAPVLTLDPSRLPDQIGLQLDTQSGVTYSIWRTSSLLPPNWQVLTNFPGNDSQILVNDPFDPAAAWFYRARAE